MAFQILFSLSWSDSMEKARQSRCPSCHLPGACQWCVCDQIAMRLWCICPIWFTMILPAEYCSDLWRKVHTMAAGWAAPKNLRLGGVKARVQPAKVTKFPKIGSPKMHRTRNHQKGSWTGVSGLAQDLHIPYILSQVVRWRQRKIKKQCASRSGLAHHFAHITGIYWHSISAICCVNLEMATSKVEVTMYCS